MQNKVSRLALPQWWGFEDKGQHAGWFLLKNIENQIKNYENCKTDFLSKIYSYVVDSFPQKYSSVVTATLLLFKKIITALKNDLLQFEHKFMTKLEIV